MLDIGLVRSSIDLFRDLLSILDQRKDRSDPMVAAVLQPCFDRLVPIVQAYGELMTSVLLRLEEPNADLAAIRRHVIAQRAPLALARSGVLGEIRALRSLRRIPDSAGLAARYGDPTEPFRTRVAVFAEAVATLFTYGDAFTEAPALHSLMTSVIAELDRTAARMQGGERGQDAPMAELRRRVRDSLALFEHNWQSVCQAFAEAKLAHEA